MHGTTVKKKLTVLDIKTKIHKRKLQGLIDIPPCVKN